jgi:hypothetical protein
MTWSDDPDRNGDNDDRKLLEEFAVWWNEGMLDESGKPYHCDGPTQIDTDDVARFLAERRR